MKSGNLVKLRSPTFGARKLIGLLLEVQKPRTKKERSMGTLPVEVLWNDGEIMIISSLRLEVIDESR